MAATASYTAMCIVARSAWKVGRCSSGVVATVAVALMVAAPTSVQYATALVLLGTSVMSGGLISSLPQAGEQ